MAKKFSHLGFAGPTGESSEFPSKALITGNFLNAVYDEFSHLGFNGETRKWSEFLKATATGSKFVIFGGKEIMGVLGLIMEILWLVCWGEAVKGPFLRETNMIDRCWERK